MINRTLIRLKVVQLLYAHLLTQTDFQIVKHPQRQTLEAKESFRFYCDTLSLLLAVTAQNGMSGALADLRDRNARWALLRNDKMLMALASDSDLRETLVKYNEDYPTLGNIIPTLSEKIKESTIYKDYSKKRKIDIDENIRFWETIIKTVIVPLLAETFGNSENFSKRAVENGCDMAIATLRNYASLRSSIIEARSALKTALETAYGLYAELLVLAIDLTRERELQLDAGKNKYIPTSEDLNPNTRFIDNRFVQSLRDDEKLQSYIKNHNVNWDADPVFITNMLAEILASKAYNEYMELPEATYADDCELWRKLFQDVILPSDALAEVMESRNVYWNDDLNIMGTFVLKSIRHAAREADSLTPFEMLPMYKDEEDSNFGIELFTKAIDHQEEYRAYIDKFVSSSWDPERIAFMDVVVMITAIAELINFPSIPMPVTMNEYTDIAADYSTARSGQFVNGLLFSVAQELKREGRIFK